jgi:hypothetical protein
MMITQPALAVSPHSEIFADGTAAKTLTREYSVQILSLQPMRVGQLGRYGKELLEFVPRHFRLGIDSFADHCMEPRSPDAKRR